MNKEERQEYNKQYRREGYGANGDARYRQKWLDKIRAKDRERKRLLKSLKNKPRRDGGVCASTIE